MILQYKIYLKGERDPIVCSEKAALTVQKLFTDEHVLMSKPITVSRFTFTKDAIRRVFVEKDRDENNIGEQTHWIIYNPKCDTVWKKSYVTYEEAKAELDFQEMSMPPGHSHSWQIEKCVANPSFH